MASFTGTLDKCKACDKTVYFVDLLSADGATFHKSCFKCSHCKGTLVMSNYSSMDGVLYCKPHFEQLFKESGNFSKNFQTEGHLASSLPCLWYQRQMPCLQQNCLPTGKGDYGRRIIPQVMLQVCSWGLPLNTLILCISRWHPILQAHFQQLFMEKGNYQHVLKAANNKKNAVEPAEAEAGSDEPEQSKENEEKEDEDEGKEPDEPEHPQQQS
ncbi:UNVERIFIED_CONTAM: LIM domain-containing protein PLIM2a [Sesamum angustifolium]|uniref:LIM domain-containing protein PLIM2a n=1 Tax=Sesamum angustifolium TaxID=2727405 RepID=A0AAW2N8T7_9LAMI